MNPANMDACKSLNRILHRPGGGFYALIASPDTQADAIERYKTTDIAVYNFAEGGGLKEIAKLLEQEPDRDAYVLLNFQLALWDGGACQGVGEWDMDAIRHLNFSRDELARHDKGFLFCMTKEADDQIGQKACDFYSYIKLFLRFEDDFAENTLRDIDLPDRSKGMDVKVDFGKTEEQMLSQAITLGHKAKELQKEFRFEDALQVLQKQRSIREKIIGTHHRDTADTYFNIGIILCDMGNYQEALEWYRKSLEICEGILGKYHPDTAAACNKIGVVYDRLKDYETALEWFHKALIIRKKVLGEDHPDIAISYSNISLMCTYLGEYSVAMEWSQRALNIRERVLGKEHADTADTYETIGIIYMSMEKYGQSLAWLRKALPVREQHLGIEHPRTGITYNIIGEAYQQMGEVKEALDWFQKARAVFEKAYGEKHPYTASVYRSLMKASAVIGNQNA